VIRVSVWGGGVGWGGGYLGCGGGIEPWGENCCSVTKS
jgi:hypothetical protein